MTGSGVIRSDTRTALRSTLSPTAFIRMSRSVRMPTTFVAFFDEHALDAAPLHEVDGAVDGVAGGNAGGLFAADGGELVAHEVLFEVAVGAGQVEVAEVLPAVDAGVDAIDVIGVTVRTDHGATSLSRSYSTLRSRCRLRTSSASRSPSPSRAIASRICCVIRSSYVGRSTARNTPIGTGYCGCCMRAMM